jgi:predicted amidohydrolase YtcJ
MLEESFFDAHVHIWEYCLFNYFTDLRSISSWEEMVERLKEKSFNGWHVGVRFNQETLDEKKIPDHEFLDHAFGSHPVIIVRTCLHLLVMNQAAMKRLDLYSPTGIFKEADVFETVNRLIAEIQLDSAEVISQGFHHLNELGITTVIDMAMNPFKRKLFDDINYYTTHFELLNEAIGFKIFLDGSLGARTAALSREYSDDRGNFGRLNYEDSDLLSIIEKVHCQGKPVAFHAIGDRAVAQFLEVIRKSRHPLDRLDHVQFASEQQLNALYKLDIPVCIQPIFSGELSWARYRLGPQRMETAYAWGLMRGKGIRLLAGSDAPVDEVDPRIAARLVNGLKGNQHLDYQDVLALFRHENRLFYGEKITGLSL